MAQKRAHNISKIDELIGWFGVGCVLGAYTIVSYDIVDNQSLVFQSMMLVGSLGVMYVAYRRRDTQPFVVNLIFAFIAVTAIIRIAFYL
jgi:hypothetical protein